ncbi:MAG TPA: YdcF family protein [Symbiobacteriaceae bacterium]|nr:YdcF family protein [Symbiobacteriaceae bacterium]
MVARLYEGMSIREISEYLFCEDELIPADLILVFGGKRLERAERAAELYKAGLAPRIVITGGDKRGTGVSESIRLRDHCVSLGVPEEAIVTECESVNSMENVKMSVALIEKLIGWQNMQGVIVVSAPHHLRRVKQALAHYIPRSVKITCCPDTREDITRNNWWHTQEGQNMVMRELEKVRTYASQGEI